MIPPITITCLKVKKLHTIITTEIYNSSQCYKLLVSYFQWYMQKQYIFTLTNASSKTLSYKIKPFIYSLIYL